MATMNSVTRDTHLTVPTHPELLAPAGGPEPFAAAVAAGADAIYCGMGKFNARRKADNFTDDAFEAACRMAHLAGTRVYVTVNIAIKDEEMADALELIRRCAALGADAFIIQDWGLFFEVKRLMPQLETHISTQANIHDKRGAAWCREVGADRVTLSRELSFEEIDEISSVDIDLEIFSHGAICFCYSGLCELSSFACAGRSANRGMCAQPCRLPYEVFDVGGNVVPTPGRERALCPRDNCTIDLLPELLRAGAGALKLEGRMKAADYVHSICSAYRAQLDDVLAGKAPSEHDRTLRARQLKRCFNRDFTSAYQHGISDDSMMSYERSNNRGQIVGQVVSSKRVVTHGLAPDDRRARAGITRIALTEPVGKGDLLELRHDEEPEKFLTAIAGTDTPAGEQIEVRTARVMPVGCIVRLIRSQAALDAASAAVKRDVPRKRMVDVRITALLGKPFSITLACKDDPSFEATATGFTVEPARTRAVATADLVEHVGRMGSSPFEAASFDIELDDGCGMSFSAVHKVRAEACRLLEEQMLAGYAQRAKELEALPSFEATALTAASPNASAAPVPAPEPAPQICATVTSLAAADAAREAGADLIYMTVDSLVAEGISPQDIQKLDIVPILDEVCRKSDHERLDAWVQAGSTVAVGNISELSLAHLVGAVAEIRSCLPVHNLACIRAMEEHGAGAIWFSPELTLAEIECIAPHAQASCGVTVMGKPRVMTSEHCILQVMDRCVHDCSRCQLRRQHYSLKNIDGKVFPVRTDIHGRSRLFDAYPLDLTPQIPAFIACGVTRFAIDGTLLDIDELSRYIAHTKRAITASLEGRKPAHRLPGTTSGCLFVGVS